MNKPFEKMDTDGLRLLAKIRQREADRLQGQAAEAQRIADRARKEIKRREAHGT